MLKKREASSISFITYGIRAEARNYTSFKKKTEGGKSLRASSKGGMR
jgi:hypothetical protein